MHGCFDGALGGGGSALFVDGTCPISGALTAVVRVRRALAYRARTCE